MPKYIKCPRCELNYILEGEDFCHVCKSEMKHHTENDEDELLDLEDMELCPVCGQNYIRENQTMCDECRGKSSEESGMSDIDKDEEDKISDSDMEMDEYNSGFSEDDATESDDMGLFKEDDELDAEPLEFLGEEEETEEESFEEPVPADDFETIDESEIDDEDDEDDEDDDFDFEDDLLGKK